MLILRGRGVQRTGRPSFNLLWVGVPLIVIPALGWLLIPGNPLLLDLPEMVTKSGGVIRVEGGTVLSSEFLVNRNPMSLCWATFSDTVLFEELSQKLYPKSELCSATLPLRLLWVALVSAKPRSFLEERFSVRVLPFPST